MSTVSLGGTTEDTFTFNALGQRVEDIPASNNRQESLYDPSGQRLGDYFAVQPTPGWWHILVPGLGRTLVDSEQWYVGAAWMYHFDALGSALDATDEHGAFLQDTLMYPWGYLWQGWTGIWAGLYYLEDQEYPWYHHSQTREYAVMQAWLSPDPLAGDISNPQSLNRYAYVLNNPESAIDPTGLGPCPPGQMCPPNGIPPSCTTFACAEQYYPTSVANFFASTGPGWDEFSVLTINSSNPPPGFIAYTNGGEPVCPGCYYDPVTDDTWDPSTQEITLYLSNQGTGGSSSIQPPPVQKPKQSDKRPSCASVFVNSMVSNPPTEQAIEQGAKAASQAFATASLTYHMRQLLVVPLRSSIVRGINGIADILGIAGEASPYLFAAATIIPGESRGIYANVTGACQNNFWSSVTAPFLSF